MPRKIDVRTDSTEVDWADDGLAIGSPNDPAIGEAYNQTTGPGGKGLTAPKKHADVEAQEADQETDIAAERENHIRNG